MPAGRSQRAHGTWPELTVDSTTMEIPNKLRGNGHWTSAYMPLQENLGGEAGKGVLTVGGASAVAHVTTERRRQ
jgi:hypothetical protein